METCTNCDELKEEVENLKTELKEKDELIDDLKKALFNIKYEARQWV